jgi:hypothetical protein
MVYHTLSEIILNKYSKAKSRDSSPLTISSSDPNIQFSRNGSEDLHAV